MKKKYTLLILYLLIGLAIFAEFYVDNALKVKVLEIIFLSLGFIIQLKYIFADKLKWNYKNIKKINIKYTSYISIVIYLVVWFITINVLEKVDFSTNFARVLFVVIILMNPLLKNNEALL